MSDVLTKVVAAQRRRLLGGIMRMLEEKVWPHLTVEQQREVRRKVLTDVGVFSDFALDMIRASSDDAVLNGHAIEEFDRLNGGS